MNNVQQEAKELLLDLLKRDGLLALAALVMGLAAQLVLTDRIWQGFAFLVLSLVIFGARTIMKANQGIKTLEEQKKGK